MRMLKATLSNLHQTQGLCDVWLLLWLQLTHFTIRIFLRLTAFGNSLHFNVSNILFRDICRSRIIIIFIMDIVININICQLY